MSTEGLKRRILSCVETTEDGCWVWTGSVNSAGYGRIWDPEEKKMVQCHRAMMDFPEGLLVCHRCDNPPCVNPDHLFVGTMSDNIRDCVNKGRAARRGAKGEANSKAKLTEREVLEIYRGTDRQRDCAARYGVTHQVVGSIRRGKTWRHVTEAETRDE